MHGQHENQALLRPEFHMELLDGSSAAVREAAALYRACFDTWHRTKERLAAVDRDARQRVQRSDMLRWQADEIDAAKLKESEEEELPRQISLLTHAEKISASVGAAWTTIDGGDVHGKGSIGLLAGMPAPTG